MVATEIKYNANKALLFVIVIKGGYQILERC